MISQCMSNVSCMKMVNFTFTIIKMEEKMYKDLIKQNNGGGYRISESLARKNSFSFMCYVYLMKLSL